jgi:hypothetical protein
MLYNNYTYAKAKMNPIDVFIFTNLENERVLDEELWGWNGCFLSSRINHQGIIFLQDGRFTFPVFFKKILDHKLHAIAGWFVNVAFLHKRS